MNYRDIEGLKSILNNMMRQGCILKVPSYGISGRIVGLGYKPFWTNPIDSKIEKLEVNFMDNYGRIIPFNFYNVIGYDIVSHDGKRAENAKNISLDILVFSPNKDRSKEPADKIRIDVTQELQE